MKLKNFFTKKTQKVNRDYFFGSYVISLGKHHVLDEYQEQYPLYDQFLPMICSGFKGLIIDIGANIGDTSIAIFSQNKESFVVGVEPDKQFFEECIQNIKRNSLSERFLGINQFVTTESGNFTVRKSASLSTGSIEKSTAATNGQTNTISFSQLMDLIPDDQKNQFDILKIDTDGFDWDILQSFSQYAKNSNFIPEFIFFEMQTFLNNNEKNPEGRDVIIDKYTDAIREVNQLGYTHFCLFDNFGTLVKKTTSIEEIFEFNQYIKRSQINNLHSTIYYLDVLAYKAPSDAYVDKILNNIYKK